MHSELVDSVAALTTFLDGLGDYESELPNLYMDLEGNNLSRDGTLSIATILVASQKKVYLIDVTRLAREAFDSPGSDGSTLRSILESRVIKKVFFDIRHDSDALFGLYGVRVQGIEDLQLMELASRDFNKRHINGLAKCIERDSRLGFTEKRAWQRTKEKGRDLFDPAKGGSYAVFDQRPLSAAMTKYCVQDVVHMPHLRDVYRAKLCNGWWRRVEAETQARIRLSQRATSNGKGQHMALAPVGWSDWRPSTREERSRTLLVGTSRSGGPSRSGPISPPSQSGNESARTAPDTERLVQLFELISLQRLRWDNDSDGEWDGGESEIEVGDLTACDSECGYCGSCPY